tara:strand:+ start:6713 stop:7825 length:1113 start_codon:yes stop_codon:yes gene_type:complete
MSRPRLRLLHETNPGKYFPALFLLGETGKVTLTGSHRYSVFKEWLRAGLKDKTPLGPRSRNALGDLCFRLRVLSGIGAPSGEVVLIGFAPWDWRILIYRRLARRNRILYQTSWHDWRLDNTPRQPKPQAFKVWLRQQWMDFMHHPNVRTIAVTRVVADTVQAEADVTARVIPHAVPETFFAAGAAKMRRSEGPLKLLYVGEISEKKGLRVLLEMMPSLATKGVTLTVVGNGPLAEDVRRVEAATDGAVRFLGPVYDRTKLAGIMAEHDILMLLSQKTTTWEELFGIVVVEALAAGLAVVASDHVGPRGILGPVDGAGLFAQDAQQDVARELEAMAADRNRLDVLYHRQVPVAEQFAIAQVAEQWLEEIEA